MPMRPKPRPRPPCDRAETRPEDPGTLGGTQRRKTDPIDRGVDRRGSCQATWTSAGRLALSPLPPLANRLWRRGWIRTRRPWGLGRIPVIYKTDEAKQWQEAMALRIREAGRGPLPPALAHRDFRVAVWLFFPDHRVRDADAPVKLLYGYSGHGAQGKRPVLPAQH